MIKYIKGDIFNSKCNIIGHGVNCQGVFNAGIAQQIRKKYPEAFVEYMSKYAIEGWKPGDVQIVRIKQDINKFVANIASQFYFGRKGKYALEYALEDGLNKVSSYCQNRGLSACFPLIGSGLGGLDPFVCREIFEKIFKKSLVRTEIYYL